MGSSDVKPPGSIDRLPSGRYRVRVQVPGSKPLTGTVPTLAEAEGLRAAFLVKLSQVGRVQTGSLTLNQWAEAWFDDRAKQGFRGVESERAMWRVRIAPTFIATLPLASVTRKHVREWVELTRNTPVRRKVRNGRVIVTKKLPELSSVRRMRAVLRSVLAGAVDREMIPANPAGGFAIKSPTTAPRWTYLTREEVERVITHDLIPLRFRLLYTVAIFTGLRRGELWALRWQDVDVESDRPHLFVRGSHNTATKTGKHRIVPLLPQARAALIRLREIVRHNEPEHYVFATSTGARRHRMDRGQWGRNGQHPGYRVVAGLKRAVPFHAFRHTCASALLQGYWGAPWAITDVQAMLGHSSLAVTQRYAHLSVEHLHARARDIASPVTSTETGSFAAAATQIRDSSTRAKGTARSTAGYPSIGPSRDMAVTMAETFLRSVRTGLADDVTRALADALRLALNGTELEPWAARCTGMHWKRRALDLAESVIESAETAARKHA